MTNKIMIPYPALKAIYEKAKKEFNPLEVESNVFIFEQDLKTFKLQVNVLKTDAQLDFEIKEHNAV